MKADHSRNDELRETLLAAAVHQARQPLFILQNTLFSSRQVTQRLESSPDVTLIQACLAQMQSAVDSLSKSLTHFAAFGSNSARAATEVELPRFVRDVFQIARFCVHQRRFQVNFEIAATLSGSMVLDPVNVQSALVQWVLDACSEATECADGSQILVLEAIPHEGDVILQLRTATHERRIRLSSFAGEIETSAPR
jgi:hypothetical protein